MSKKIIYDFGSNNGDDIPYYLTKSDLVVAVEANPLLCNLIRTRFSAAIASGRLVVENCVLDVGEASDEATFYIHKHNHVLSQFPRPSDELIGNFEAVRLPSKNVVDLIRSYGDPHYIKIDIEHFDEPILVKLFESGIRPPYISAESHSIGVFATMVALGRYDSFKLVDGQSVVSKYANHTIRTPAGPTLYSFPHHSAGPFGEDIAGPWMTRDNFHRLLGFAGLGWRDVHASRCDEPDPIYSPQPQIFMNVTY